MTPKRSLVVGIAALALITLAACGTASGTEPSPRDRTVDQAEATQLAQSALEALNAGDYAAYSEHWSDEMKAAIKEADFLAFREQVLASLGSFVEIEDVETTSVQPGTYRYVFTVAFERGEAKLAFGFHDGSDLIHGVFAL